MGLFLARSFRGGCRIFERRGSNLLGLHARKRGGGPALGPMLKSLHRGPKGGGVQTLGPRPLDPLLGLSVTLPCVDFMRFTMGDI